MPRRVPLIFYIGDAVGGKSANRSNDDAVRTAASKRSAANLAPGNR